MRSAGADRCSPGSSLYIVASMGIVFVTSVEALTALRFVQGFAASAGMVLSMAIVRDRFEGIQVGKALARLMLVVGVAPSIAPLIGAQFLRLGSWRYMFVALAVFGVVLLVLAFFLLKESLPATAAALRRGRRGRPLLRLAAARPDVHGTCPAERLLDGRAVHLRLVGDVRLPGGLRPLRAAVRGDLRLRRGGDHRRHPDQRRDDRPGGAGADPALRPCWPRWRSPDRWSW